MPRILTSSKNNLIMNGGYRPGQVVAAAACPLTSTLNSSEYLRKVLKSPGPSQSSHLDLVEILPGDLRRAEHSTNPSNTFMLKCDVGGW